MPGGGSSPCHSCGRQQQKCSAFPRLLPAGRYIACVSGYGVRHDAELPRGSSDRFHDAPSRAPEPALGWHWYKASSRISAARCRQPPEQGSTFDIYLRGQDGSDGKADHAAPLPRGHGERVLLVETRNPDAADRGVAGAQLLNRRFPRPSGRSRGSARRSDASSRRARPAHAGNDRRELKRGRHQLRSDVGSSHQRVYRPGADPAGVFLGDRSHPDQATGPAANRRSPVESPLSRSCPLTEVAVKM